MKCAIYGAGSLGTVLGAYMTKNGVASGSGNKLCEYKGVTYYQKYAFNKWYNIKEYCANRYNLSNGKQQN